MVFRFERPGTECTWVWTIRFTPIPGGLFSVTCNGAGNIVTSKASKTTAKRMLGRYLNWACFADANEDSRASVLRMVEDQTQPSSYGVDQWDVHSESNPDHCYRVTLKPDGSYACGCMGWTRHVPRKDCKHIRWVRKGMGTEVDPLMAAVERIQHRKGLG